MHSSPLSPSLYLLSTHAIALVFSAVDVYSGIMPFSNSRTASCLLAAVLIVGIQETHGWPANTDQAQVKAVGVVKPSTSIEAANSVESHPHKKKKKDGKKAKKAKQVM